MLFSTYAVAAVSALFTLGASQSIDPNSVPLSLRDFWCQSQTTACPLICTQETQNDGNGGSAGTLSNDCVAESLSYSCVCANGLSPNVSEYSQTIPYFTCTESNTQCVANCGMNNNACAASCTQDHPCGAQNPTRINATTSSASGTASATGNSASGTNGVYSGFGSSASSTGSSSGSSSSGSSSSSSSATKVVLSFGQLYGVGVVVSGIVVGFGLLL